MTQKFLENEGATPLGTLFRPHIGDKGNLRKGRLHVPRVQPDQHDQPDCLLLSLKNSDEQVESLWVKIREKPTKETSWLVFTTGHVIKVSLLTKHSYFNYRKHHTSIPLTSAGKAAQQAVSSPGDSWSVSRIIFKSRR